MLSEKKITNWLFLLLLVSFAGAILGDSTAEALLLSHFDSTIIPHMFLINAVLLFFCSAIMISIIDRVNRGTFFLAFIWVHASVLMLIKVVTLYHLKALYIPLFSYAYVSKIIIFLLFWTIANDLIDSRKASRRFPIIAAGGTFGAIVVSFSIPALMKFFQAENLVLIWSLLIVLSEPLLRNMSILYFLIFFLLLNQQYLFFRKFDLTSGLQRVSHLFLGFLQVRVC